MSSNIIKTNSIILRKTVYQESSLIIYTLTPDFGRVDFLVRGALKISKKQSPIIDLFREIEISYLDKSSGLYTPKSTDLISEHDNIALYAKAFNDACKISSFLLNNTYANINCRLTYSALKHFLKYASQGQDFRYPQTMIKVVYLYEHGLIPEYIIDNGKEKSQKRFINDLISYSIGQKKQLPTINIDYWDRFIFWINKLCDYHNLN